MATVEDLPTGKVVGQFLFVSQDNADAGTKPNAVLVTGYVRFTCSASPILYYSRKVTAVPLVHDAVFDSEGYLMPLDSTQADGGKVVAGKLERGMELLANAPGVNPEGFTWTATFNLKEAATGRALSIPSFSFLLSAGQTVDVADIFPVGASGGVLVTRGQSAYEVAVANGFTGTQAQWLTSLLAPKSVFTIGAVTASEPGSAAKVTVEGNAPNHTLSFTLPRGIQGPQGETGATPNLKIGTVTTVTNPADDEWVSDLVRSGPLTRQAIVEALPTWGTGVNLAALDLDTITTPGLYYQPSAAAALVAANHYPPMPNWGGLARGVLHVSSWSGGQAILQEYHHIGDGIGAATERPPVVWRRYKEATWGKWFQFAATRSVTDGAGFRTHQVWDDGVNGWVDLSGMGQPIIAYSGDNANKYTTPGTVYQTSGSTTALNWPIAGKGHLFVIGAPGTVQQIFYPLIPLAATAAKVSYTRVQLTAETWSPWSVFTSTQITTDAVGFKQVSIWDDTANANLPISGPGGWTVAPTLGAANLNDVSTPGLYRQVSSPDVTLAKNYPEAGKVGTLSVEVRIPAGQEYGPSVSQTYTPFHGNPAAEGRIFYRRILTGMIWQPWRAYTSQRVDNTAGRAIYTWDDTNSREQLIYGDTGWRTISNEAALFLNDFICTSALVRRVGNLVTLNFDGFKSPTASGNVGFIALPEGFRHDVGGSGTGNQRYTTATELTGANPTVISPESTGGSTFNGILRFLSYVSGRALHGSVSYYTRDPWPTTLPGTAVGTIPNL